MSDVHVHASGDSCCTPGKKGGFATLLTGIVIGLVLGLFIGAVAPDFIKGMSKPTEVAPNATRRQPMTTPSELAPEKKPETPTEKKLDPNVPPPPTPGSGGH